MATRSTITVRGFHRKEVHLYRHWDGYPEATGRHLCSQIKRLESLTVEELVAKLITAKEGEPYGSGSYEFTSHADHHGDAQWHYEITLHHREEPKIAVFERPIGGSFGLVYDGPLHGYRKWIVRRFRKFIAFIKTRRAA